MDNREEIRALMDHLDERELSTGDAITLMAAGVATLIRMHTNGHRQGMEHYLARVSAAMREQCGLPKRGGKR